MSRRHRAEKRQVLPDPKFKDIILSKFMNQIMQDGKKSTAERIVYGALDLVEIARQKRPCRGSSTKRSKRFHQLLRFALAALVVRPYQVPVEVRS